MNEIKNEEKAKAYELRNLRADDMFPMFKIISGIGVKEFKACFESDEVKAMIEGKNGKKNDEKTIGVSIAFDIASILASNLPKCKSDIYNLLAGLSGMSVKEISELDMATFVEMIFDVVKKKEFKDFFQAVSKLFK